MNNYDFIEREKERHPNFDYSNTIYTGMLKDITVKCKKCNNFLTIKAKNFCRAKEPCKCSNNHHEQYTFEEWQEKANKIHNYKYDYSLVDYKNSKSKIKIICKQCGNVFCQLTDNHLRGHGCNICANKEREEKQKKIYNIENIRILDYTNARTKAKLLCLIHNEIFYQRIPDLIRRGPVCDKCSKKNIIGEEIIKLFLYKNNISFIPQKTFSNLSDKSNLSYDFYIPSKNLLIEYNGIQHYEWIRFFQKEYNSFLLQKHHDWLKRKYAKKNGITLLVIPYWEFNNIEEILGTRLGKIPSVA